MKRSLTLKNGYVFEAGKMKKGDVFIDGEVFAAGDLSPEYSSVAPSDISGLYILPGLTDVHVHLREPGFSYKETIKTGSMAAARGGYRRVCTMPNLDPVPDTLGHLKTQLDIIERDGAIEVVPFGSITLGEKGDTLSDMEDVAPLVAGFSDDGRGVQSRDVMREAMLKAKELGKVISAHCEVNSLLNGGYIHDGIYAKEHGHRGIPSESEWREIERDLELAFETGVKFHVCHVSTKESISLIRDAKKSGVDVTCETGPHYLLLDETYLCEDGRFKMNPPLRGPRDREAIIEAMTDGTLDMIATDHAPHSAKEKSRGLEKSAMGVVGIETAFPLMYTGFVRRGIITLERLMELMCFAPCRRFGFQCGIEAGGDASFSVWDLENEYTVDPGEFLSMGKSTPFAGERVYGRCVATYYKGKKIYSETKAG